ncbi:hypothetical protein JRO89_XS13G0238000 [Xanthoceras sorbifolium]|uniref:DNA-binding protein RHL1 n=1 Tax=Xanthoceras sorbifolium TaxID=99658 RepID=A0ABQ8H9U1_9ROSI|nr:hypothetical protein JRO89_XS13G0238000 [Xanthoceras sorbifolium]
MVRASSSKSSKKVDDKNIERTRLKNLAIKKRIVSETPAKGFTPLGPTKQVVKHHGKDILRKSSQRKNRFLFSFPGLLGPIGGGKIGELKNLGTQNPVLYLDFPQGQMKLFGTIVYPENNYLTLQFSRGGKNVMCEDYFDNMIVFSDAWWIGRKEENPDEARLDFPKELSEGQDVEYDFKGGAGATAVDKGVPTAGMKDLEEGSPEAQSEDEFSDVEKKLKDKMEVTPVRHSERTAGKRFRFVEVSSEDDPAGSDADLSEGEEKKSVTKSRKLFESTVTETKSKEDLRSHGSLVQATISTLFKKVEEKAEVSRKKEQVIKAKSSGTRRTAKKKKAYEVLLFSVYGFLCVVVEEDDIEEFSNTSKTLPFGARLFELNSKCMWCSNASTVTVASGDEDDILMTLMEATKIGLLKILNRRHYYRNVK